MAIEDIIAKMSRKEKIRFCTGADFWRTKARRGIPSFAMADGPHGLRVQAGKKDMLGVCQSLPATCFPAAVTAAAAWNPELYAAEGRAIGLEAAAAGITLVLGPGCNIKRDPHCGRNFEYLSEDPFLSGRLAAAYVRGMQETGVSACLKHFAANNQETKRQNGDSRVDERALREIYLAPFEAAVQEGKPGAVMCAYNKLNGVHASDSRWLLDRVLRREWGFDGMVVTDWGALNDRVEAFQAGCDLNMPGGSRFMERECLQALRNGTLDEAKIDASVARIAAMALRERPAAVPADLDAHHELARTVAQQGAVLLKNQGDLLPAAAEDMALIGHMAAFPRYQGTGSSRVNPTRLVSLRDALPDAPFLACCDQDGNVTEQALEEAAALARTARVAVVVAGLPDISESEGFDRRDLSLPEGNNRMVQAVAGANPNTVVVLLGGGPMVLPWLDQVPAVLYMGLPGQAGGQACADLLTGRACPCGKLAETWPLSQEDLISRDSFGRREVEYRESVYVGYRYYDKANKAVAFPFGHGLSYTQFVYSGLEVSETAVSVTVTNTGKCSGAEVAQLYLFPPQGGLHRPLKELKGFARVELAPGESQRITFPLNRRSFSLWQDGWRVAAGDYGVLLGSSSRDIRLWQRIQLEGETIPAPVWQPGSWYETMFGLPPRVTWIGMLGRSVTLAAKPTWPVWGKFTMDNSCLEMREWTPVIELMYRIIKWYVSRCFGGDHTNPSYRMMLACAVDCPLRALVINSGGRVPAWLLKLLLEIANGRWWQGWWLPLPSFP